MERNVQNVMSPVMRSVMSTVFPSAAVPPATYNIISHDDYLSVLPGYLDTWYMAPLEGSDRYYALNDGVSSQLSYAGGSGFTNSVAFSTYNVTGVGLDGTAGTFADQVGTPGVTLPTTGTMAAIGIIKTAAVAQGANAHLISKTTTGETSITNQNWLVALDDTTLELFAFHEYSSGSNSTTLSGITLSTSTEYYVGWARDTTAKKYKFVVSDGTTVQTAEVAYTSNPTGGENGFFAVGGSYATGLEFEGNISAVTLFDSSVDYDNFVSYFTTLDTKAQGSATAGTIYFEAPLS
jgi:hypothetical protein